MVSDDNALLDLLSAHEKGQDRFWRPTRYWAAYTEMMKDRIRRTGLKSCRADDGILAAVGSRRPSLFYRRDTPELDSANREIGTHRGPDSKISKKIPVSVKKFVAGKLLSLPPFAQAYKWFQVPNLCQIADRYYFMALSLFWNELTRCASFGALLKNVSDSGEGGAEDLIERDGARMGFDSLMSVIHAGFIQKGFKKSSGLSFIEIGGGYGSLCEITKKALGVRRYLLLDICPMCYVATQYLKSVFPGEVVDYSDLHDATEISEESWAGRSIMVLPVWMLPKVRMKFDCFVNAISFQEMEPEIIKNYLGFISRIAVGAYVHTLAEGHGPGVNDETVSFSKICRYLTEAGYKSVEGVDLQAEEKVLEYLRPAHVSKCFRRISE